MSGVSLRVLSYNVHGLRDDRAALSGLVREIAPDVVIVQEAPRRFRWRTRCAALADSFGMVVAEGGMPALGNLLLVSLRVRVHETWCLRYPLTPGRHLRGAAFARCSVRGARFTVSGSHLATDPAERPTQAALWKESLAGVEGPLVAGGDLNEGPGGGAWRTVADGLTDTAGPGGGSTLTFPATLPRLRLDGLFVSPGIGVKHYEVVESDAARRASDHLPVLAELTLPSE
ncbi:endonuclease/exonuclease/phosphatase family protein [Actinoplanes sp. NPDC051494]|uniref:endonuclease/exonuclease/phosphatase family protein n=1 Tax=Actinoplanes sp. NPDC051494 TaxID=3363907 RepID=UPI0037B8CD97